MSVSVKAFSERSISLRDTVTVCFINASVKNLVSLMVRMRYSAAVQYLAILAPTLNPKPKSESFIGNISPEHPNMSRIQ